MSETKQTPMMAQYQAIKAGLPEKTLLFAQLGDFYEAFGEDAKVAARLMGVALTKRGGSPECGFPAHAKESYIATLAKAGWKVAIFDPFEEKGVAK